MKEKNQAMIDETKVDYNKIFCKELMTLTVNMAN